MEKLLLNAFILCFIFGISACGIDFSKVADDLKPSSQQQKAMNASEYPEFTKAYMAQMPALESGFFGSSDVKFAENGDAMIYKVKEFQSNFEANDWGLKSSNEAYKKVLNKYLTSDLATNNSQFKAFVQVCNELSLKVKKYRNDLLSKTRIYLPYYNQGNYDSKTGTKRVFEHNLDYIYLAFDKNNEIKVIFTYEHEFFYSNNGVKHEKMWALLWYGSSAIKAQQAFNNDLLDRYEVK